MALTSATAARRALLAVKVKALFDASHGTYGYRRLHAALVRGGEQVTPELVRPLMCQLGLVACQPRPWRKTTVRDGKPATAPDRLARNFTAPEPGTKLVAGHHLRPHLVRLAVPGYRHRLLQQ